MPGWWEATDRQKGREFSSRKQMNKERVIRYVKKLIPFTRQGQKLEPFDFGLEAPLREVPMCAAEGRPCHDHCICEIVIVPTRSTLIPELQHSEEVLYQAVAKLKGGERARATVALENLVAEITELSHAKA